METLSLDTHPEFEKLQIQRLGQMPPWRKMALVGEMNRQGRTLANESSDPLDLSMERR